MDKEQLILEINAVVDPDINLRLGEMDSVKSIDIASGIATVEIDLVGPIAIVGPIIEAEVKKVIEDAGFKSVVLINEIEHLDANRQLLKKVKHIIAVASGKGGVGKSALAGNIAALLSKTGAKVGLLDADVYGPSQPTMFGLKDARLEAETDHHGKTSAVPIEKDGLKIASMGFVLNRDEAAIVRGPMLASYFSLLFEQLEWGELDFLVFDLPPGTGDIQLTLVQKVPLSGAVIVTTPQEIALADVRRSIAMFRKVNVDILGIIENMSYFSPEDMPDKKYYIFGKDGGKIIAYENNVPLLAQVPLDIEMREANDGGNPIALSGRSPKQVAILKHAMEQMVSELRKRNYNNLNNSLEISI